MPLPVGSREEEEADTDVPMASIDEAIAAVGRGEMVVVMDDEDRENEGDLVMAAEFATPEKVAFFLAHTSGLICAPLMPDRLDELELPLMVSHNTESQRTAFTVTVDYRHGTTTGISAVDRAATIRALINPDTKPDDLARPGHVLPLRYRPGGVLKRAGHTEATVDLARFAGCYPAGLLCEIVTEDKQRMARRPELERFASDHGLPIISIGDLVRYRHHREKLVEQVARSAHPHRARRVHRLRLQVAARRRGASRLRGRRRAHQGERAGPRAQRVPHRRRVPLAALRLRVAAGSGDPPYRRGGRGRDRLPPRPRRAGHRPHPQAARLQPSGQRLGYRRRERRAGAPRRQSGVRHRRPDPRGARGDQDAPDDEQPGEVRGARGLWARHRRTGGLGARAEPGERQVLAHEERTARPPAQWPRPGRARSPPRRRRPHAGPSATPATSMASADESPGMELDAKSASQEAKTSMHRLPAIDDIDRRGARGADDGTGLRIAVACSRFNGHVTGLLLAGALAELDRCGVAEADRTVVWVPGAFELPLAAMTMAGARRFDAVVCLGAVIRGETSHYDFVAGQCAAGIQRVQLDMRMPVVFGVLTTENLEQALAARRWSRREQGDRGGCDRDRDGESDPAARIDRGGHREQRNAGPKTGGELAMLRLVLPKGSLELATFELFAAADLTVRRASEVAYRAAIDDPPRQRGSHPPAPGDPDLCGRRSVRPRRDRP